MADNRTRKPRTPSKIRSMREVMTEELFDLIPTRDTPEKIRLQYRDDVNRVSRHECENQRFMRRPKSGRRSLPHELQHDQCGVMHKRRHTVSIDGAVMTDRRTGTTKLNVNKNNVIGEGVSSRNLLNQKQSAVGKSLSATVSTNSMSILSRNIYKLWKNKQLCDVVLYVDGKRFFAHRLVLATVSDLFADQEDESREKLTEYDVDDASAEAMDEVLNYVYTSKLKIDKSNVEGLLSISRQLDMTKLSELCGTFLKKSVSMANAVKNRELAEKYGMEDTRSSIDNYLHSNFQTLVSTPAFLRSDFNAVYDIISSDVLVTQNELQIFHACASWIDFNRQNRMKYIVPLMGLVKFVSIAPKDIVSEVEPFSFIFDIPECKDMLYNAFRHHALYSETSFVPNNQETPHRKPNREKLGLENSRSKSTTKTNVSKHRANRIASSPDQTPASSKSSPSVRRSLSSILLEDEKIKKHSAENLMKRSKSDKGLSESATKQAIGSGAVHDYKEEIPSTSKVYPERTTEWPKTSDREPTVQPSREQCNTFKAKFIEARSKHSMAEDQRDVSVANFSASKSKHGSRSGHFTANPDFDQSRMSVNIQTDSNNSLPKSSLSAFKEVTSEQFSHDPQINHFTNSSHSKENAKRLFKKHLSNTSAEGSSKSSLNKVTPDTEVQTARSTLYDTSRISGSGQVPTASEVMSRVQQSPPKMDSGLLRQIRIGRANSDIDKGADLSYTQERAHSNADVQQSIASIVDKQHEEDMYQSKRDVGKASRGDVQSQEHETRIVPNTPSVGKQSLDKMSSHQNNGVVSVANIPSKRYGEFKQQGNSTESKFKELQSHPGESNQRLDDFQGENRSDSVIKSRNIVCSKTCVEDKDKSRQNVNDIQVSQRNIANGKSANTCSTSQDSALYVDKTKSDLARMALKHEIDIEDRRNEEEHIYDNAPTRHSKRSISDDSKSEMRSHQNIRKSEVPPSKMNIKELGLDRRRFSIAPSSRHSFPGACTKKTGVKASGQHLGNSVSDIVEKFSRMSSVSQKVTKNDLAKYSDFEESVDEITVKPEGSSVQYSSKSLTATKPSVEKNNNNGLGHTPWPSRPSIIYIVGGINPHVDGPDFSSVCRMLQLFDPVANTWNTGRFIPTALHDCAVTILGDQLFVTGGQKSLYRDPTPSRDCYVYNISKDMWRKAGSLITARTRHAAVTVDGVVYVVGGEDANEISTTSVERYRCFDDNWEAMEPMKEPRVGLAAVGHRYRMMVVGGMMNNSTKLLLDTVEVYDPTDGRWAYRARFPIAVCGASMTEVGRDVYVVGGYIIRNEMPISVDSVFRYRDELDCWEVFQTLEVPRHDAVTAAIGTRLYVVGGESSATTECALSDVECIDVSKNVHVPNIPAMLTSAYGISGCAYVPSY